MLSKFHFPSAARIAASATGMALAGLALTATSPAPAQEIAQPGAASPDMGLRNLTDDQGGQTSPGASGDAPNYRQPRPRPDPRRKYPGRAQTYPHPLPALVRSTAPSAARSARQSPGGDATDPAIRPAPTVAALPAIPAKSRPAVESDPYAPAGIGVGSLRLVPYIEADGGYDSNPNRASTGVQGSSMLRTELGGTLKSDWSVHQLTGDWKFGYSKYSGDPTADRPDGQGKLDLRLDATRDTALDLELRGNLDSQRPGSTEFTATNVRGRPLITTVGTSFGVTEKFNRLELGLHGSLDRTEYEDATLTDGTTLPLSVDNYSAYGLQARIAYEMTPGIKPFVEVSADQRRRDHPVDSSGFLRDSSGIGAKLGSSFELTRLLTGELAVGYAQRSYADTRVPLLSGATVDAALIWTATPLTTVTLKAATSLNETTVPFAAGAVTHTFSTEVSHALLRNLTIGATGSLGINDYQGVSLHEVTLSGGLKADYNLTRSLVVRGSFTHERLQSSAIGSDYTANVFMLGLRLQR